MPCIRVQETFESIQGESSFAGATCFFIRLSGCNLRCGYCDTPRAWEEGVEEDVDALVRRAVGSRAAIMEVTGGEPLLQESFPVLASRLRDAAARPVLVETNGTLSLARIPEGVVAVVDVKCPGSGYGDSFDLDNLARLRPCDEVKFVLSDRADYEWARSFVSRYGLAARCRVIFFSPVAGRLEPGRLAQWLLEDGSPARLQVQLHKVIGVA